MQTSFFNTTNLSGAELIESREAAMTQNDKVLRYFRDHSRRAFTPIEVSSALGSMLLTSVRRAITTLTAQGKLIRTANKTREKYGAVNYKWQYNETVTTEHLNDPQA
jgi:hypothetical protein